VSVTLTLSLQVGDPRRLIMAGVGEMRLAAARKEKGKGCLELAPFVGHHPLLNDAEQWEDSFRPRTSRGQVHFGQARARGRAKSGGQLGNVVRFAWGNEQPLPTLSMAHESVVGSEGGTRGEAGRGEGGNKSTRRNPRAPLPPHAATSTATKATTQASSRC